MKGKTLEIMVAVSLFFVGLSLITSILAPYTGFPVQHIITFTVIAGIIAVFSAFVIAWDAFRGKE